MPAELTVHAVLRNGVRSGTAFVIAIAVSMPTSAQDAYVPIKVPDQAISPETAAAVSGLTLLAGVAGGTILLVSSASAGGVRPQLPGVALIASAFVFAPSLGRWLGGDEKTAAIRTVTRLVGAGTACAAAFYGFDEGGGGPRPGAIAVFGLLTPIVVAHALADVWGTERDLRLNRAVEAFGILRNARGESILAFAVPF
jgi:hypothetical protein